MSSKKVIGGSTITDADPLAVGITNAMLGKLVKGGATTVAITCTSANTDYAAATGIPANVKYVLVYCASDCIISMGEATSSSVGIFASGGGLLAFTVAKSGNIANDTPHAQSSTAGAVVYFTWMSD